MIGNKSKTIELLQQHQLRAKKKFGQNFLADPNTLEKIVKVADITKETCVIEIGPGLGALTEVLAKSARKVLAYEIDPDMVEILKDTLKNETNIVLKQQDILTVELDQDIHEHLQDETELVVVANLPYYITTPIIMKVLKQNAGIKKIIIMMQKEVAQRIVSPPKHKEYGYLSVVCQYYGHTKIAFDVPRTVFIPKPNVDSAIVVINLYDQKKYHPNNEEFFFEFLRAIFVQKRKTLSNNIHSSYQISKEGIETLLHELKINPKVRAEELSILEMVQISNFLNNVHRRK